MNATDLLFRDFDAEIATAEQGKTDEERQPVKFKLDGFVFECVTPLPLGSILVMVRKAAKFDINSTSMEDMMAQAGIIDVFWSWIRPEHHARFDEAVSKLTNFKVFQDIMEHIMTASTGRPTEGSLN